MPESACQEKAPFLEKFIQMDPMGISLILAAIICYILALQWGGVTKSWRDPNVIGTFTGFGLLLVAFIAWEWRLGNRSMLQPRILKQRKLVVMALYMFFIAGPFYPILYYLPIYFQSVLSVSAARSGIYSLPFVLGTSIFSIVSGGLITAYGYYTPLMIVAACLTAVGTGLLYTLGAHSGPGEWIGYQIITGIGTGLGLQIAVIVSQASVDAQDMSSIQSIMLFFQSIGGSLFLTAAQSIFTNRLSTEIFIQAPGADPSLVIRTGASQLASVFPPNLLPGIVEAYVQGIKGVFILIIATASLTLPIALLSPWERLLHVKEVLSGAL